MGFEIKNRLYEICQVAAEFYQSCFMSERGEKALSYLTNRNLTLDTIKTFGIGAAPDECDALMRHLREKGYSVTEMAEAGLIVQNKNNQFSDRFRARIMFPLTDAQGRAVAFSSRTLSNNSSATTFLDFWDSLDTSLDTFSNDSFPPTPPTFLNTTNTRIYDKAENLFGLNIAKKYCSEQIVLVEGIIDAISLYQAGIKGVVAVQGVNFTERQAALIAKYTKKVVICYDSDAAGKKGTERTTEILKSCDIPVAAITLEDGMDPYDFISKHGGEKLKELIDIAANTINTRYEGYIFKDEKFEGVKERPCLEV